MAQSKQRSEQIRRTVETWAKRYSEKDTDSWGDLFASNAVYLDAPTGMELHGRLAMKAWHYGAKHSIPNGTFTVKDIIMGENHAAVIYSAHGIYENPMVQLPPECNGHGVFESGEGVVTLKGGDKVWTVKRFEDGHFDISSLPSLGVNGMKLIIPNGVAIFKIDDNGLIAEGTEYYDRLPTVLAMGAATVGKWMTLSAPTDK